MVDAFYADNNRFQVINADDISFDTDRPSVELFTDQKIVTTRAVSFPAFIHKWAYFRAEASNGTTACQCWSTVIWQEWGPDEGTHTEAYYPNAPQNSIPGPTTRNIPRIHLGSIPAGTTLLDIRMKATRTSVPAPWFRDVDPRPMFKLDEWVTLTGGSCPVEWIGPMAREMTVARIGNELYLELRQSIQNANTTSAPGGAPQADINVNFSGWNSFNYSGSFGGGVYYSNYYVSHLISEKGPDIDGNKRPTGTNPCAGLNSVTPDSGTSFSIQFEITPGRHRTA